MKSLPLSRISLSVLASSLLAMTTLGCGSSEFRPPLATVKGSVSLNDKPLPDVTVTFEPLPGSGSGKEASIVGGTSMAVTDAEGNYSLSYMGGASKGAVIGQHIVRITSAAGGGPAGGADAVSAIPIPSNYNSNSSLTANVSAGENKLDFALQSKTRR